MIYPRFVVSARGRKRAGVGVALLALTATTTVITGAQPAAARTAAEVVRSAAAYGPAHNTRVGIAVYDTRTGHLYGSGSYKSTFASESVVKAMIATRLLLQGRMHGTTATRAYKMITQSDDAIASSFYGSVGGDGLINWIKRHYGVPDLGSPPHRPYWWGNTHITAAGLVKFYAKVKKDRRVGPWLLNAMHHARKYGSDGTYQFFGLPSATSGAAVKQGWGTDYDDWGRSADFNTTGFVNGDRYAVAILARGPVRYYGRTIGNILTHTARVLLPGGHFPDPVPTITHRSHITGPTAGGQAIQLLGNNFTHVTKVMFGGYAGRSLRVASSHTIYVTSPPHKPMRVPIRVFTDHGISASSQGYYTYIAAPTLTSVSPPSGPVGGGNEVTISGTDFRYVWSVSFGSRRGTAIRVTSPTSLTVTVPPGVSGTVSISVRTCYGTSTTAQPYTYVSTTPPPPTTTAPTTAPPTAPSTGASTAAPTTSGPAQP